MDEEKFGAIANFNSNRRQLEKIKKDLEEKSSLKKKADLKPIAGESGKKEIKKSVGADVNKDAGGLKKAEKFDFRQAVFEKEVQETLPVIFNAEAIDEAINDKVGSDTKAEKIRKIISLVKDDLNSVAKDPEWYKLKWRNDELKNALKRHFIKKANFYFNAERLTGAKKFHNYLEGLCKIEKKERKEYREQKERKEQPLNEEKKEFLENFGKELEKGVLEKLNENNKEVPEREPVKEFVRLGLLRPLAKKAISTIKEAFQKNENLKKENIVNLLQKGTAKWEYLSQKEQDLIMRNFERLARSKKDNTEKPPKKTEERKIKKNEIDRRDQLAEDKAGGKIESSGKYYTGAGAPEDAREEPIKLKNGKKTEEKEKNPPLRKMEEIEKERSEKARKEIDKYFPETKEDIEEPKAGKTMEEVERRRQKEADEKIKEFFSKETEEIERKGVPISRMEELEKLKGELEIARKEYMEMDYKKRDMWARVRNYFGNILGKGWKEKRRDNITTDEKGTIKDDDVLYLEAIYKNKLFDYKNALLDEIFAKNLPEEENKKRLAEAVNYFGKEEFIKLSEACNDARAEYMKKEEPTMGERIASGLSRIERSYYKLPKAARYAIGIGTMASGVGFLIGGKRILSGFLLGYSTYRAGAGIDNFMAGRQDKRFQKKTLRDFENREDKYKFINDKLNEKLFNVDERLHGRDWRKLSYAAAGAVLGTLVGTGKAAEFAHWLAQEANIGAIPEKFHSLIKNVREMLGGAPIEDYPVPKVPIAPEAPIASEIPVAPEAPEVSPVELTIEKGSSLEGTLIDYIKDHQAEIYDHHPELKNFDPGQIAHRMYLDYLHENANPLNKSLDLVYPGAEIEIDPATLRISEFADTRGVIGRAIEQAAGNHEKWAGMKNLSLKELAGAAKNKIAELSGEYGKFWGPEAEIKGGEKIKDWLARVVRLAAEKK